MPGIRELARACGVGVATVSRAINGKPDVSPEMRRRVLEAAEAIGYSPSGAARRLATKRGTTIGIVVPFDFNVSERQLFAGIERHLVEEGYTSLFFFSGWDGESERDCLGRLKSEKLDGVIMMHEARDPAFYDYLDRGGVPTVLCAITRPDLPFPSVHVDEAAAAAEATGHLLGLGHERVAYVSGAHSSFPLQRGAGYRAALEAAGLGYDEGLVARAEGYTARDGRTSAVELLARGLGFTALFASTDELAIGAMRALRDSGRRVPEEVSVVGFDDIEVSAYLSPSLTTCAQPWGEIGRETAAIVARLVAGEGGGARGSVLPHRLMIRESSGPR